MTLTPIKISPLLENPAAIYLASLSTGSRRTMKTALNQIAILIDPNSDCFTFPWHKLERSMTTAIRAHLSETYAPATASRMLTAVKMVLKECQRMDLIDPAVYSKAVDLKPIRGERPLKGRALSSSEISAIVSACSKDESNRGVRDLAMVAVLRIGLRRSEVVKLDVGDINLSAGTVLVRAGKGNKTRSVFLADVSIPWIKAWMERLGGEALFPRISKSDRILSHRLTDSAVRFIFEERGKEAGITEKFSCHDWRRSCISDMLDAGVDIATASKIAGHSSVVTTQKYDRRGEGAHKSAVNQLEF